MPYIIIRGNLASYSHKYPWRVLVSGLKGGDIDQLRKFPCGGYSDESTIVYLVHPCVILSACEVLGYRVVASSSTSVKQDYNEYMWTMRREFDVPEPTTTTTSSTSCHTTSGTGTCTAALGTDRAVSDNLSNFNREQNAKLYHKVDSPE